MGKKLYVGNLAYGVTDSDSAADVRAARHRAIRAGHHGPRHGPLQGIRLCGDGQRPGGPGRHRRPERQRGRRPRPDRQRSPSQDRRRRRVAATAAAGGGRRWRWRWRTVAAAADATNPTTKTSPLENLGRGRSHSAGASARPRLALEPRSLSPPPWLAWSTSLLVSGRARRLRGKLGAHASSLRPTASTSAWEDHSSPGSRRAG